MLYLIMNHLFAAYTFQKPLENREDGTRFASRPLKQWRKQYNTNLGYSRAATGMPMDRPGGLVPVATPALQCTTCKGALAARVNVFNDSPCSSCNPIKAKVTPLSETAYTDTAAYRQSRCVAYDQKLAIEQVPRIHYFSPAGLPLEPSDSPTGAQVRETAKCYPSSTKDVICTTTIYKPNNTQFAQQGGVSSSSRLARLKYNTLNNAPVNNNGILVNGSVFNTAAGAMGINSGRYQTEPSPSYYTKSKPQAVTFPFKTGKKIYCPAANTLCK